MTHEEICAYADRIYDRFKAGTGKELRLKAAEPPAEEAVEF